MTDKPPYRIPPMAEIAAVPWNGLVAVDFFAGGGGTTTGLRIAGYRVPYACEFVDEAADCHHANHPDGHVDRRDVRDVKGDEVLDVVEAATGARHVDLLAGSPPCVGFSTAGTREKGWGVEATHADGSSGRSDDLFLEFARLLGELRPRAFAAENVSGLVKGVAKGYFAEIMRALEAHGYRVQARMLDAQWLGVPQARQRVIIVGIRDDLGADPEFPAPLPYRYSIRDALPNLTAYALNTGGTAYANRPDGKRHVDVDEEASPTVMASPNNIHHYEVAGEALPELGVRTPTGPGMQMRDVDPDEPIGSIRAGRAGIELVNAGPPLEVADDDPAVDNPPVVHEPPKDPDCLYLERGPKDDALRTEASLDEPAPTVAAAGMGNVREYQASVPVHDPETGARIDLDGTAIGTRWDRLKPGQFDTVGTGPALRAGETHYLNLGKPDPDGPIPTVTASGGGRGVAGVTHPTQRRKLTLAELRRLCGFPDDYVLPGRYQAGWARLGNSVPPPMAAAYTGAIRDVLQRVDAERG